LALLAGAAAAQTAVEQRSAADELRYESPIRTYRPYSEEIVQPWRESNDQVGRIGGWRAYAKEIQNSEASQPSSATDTHKGHHEGAKP
jgi:hypothetical protein